MSTPREWWRAVRAPSGVDVKRFILAVGLLAAASPAGAEDLVIHSRGGLHVWVDGVPLGEVSRRQAIVLDVTPGEHEVAASYFDDLSRVHCYGLANVGERGAIVGLRHSRCDGLRTGLGPEGSSAIAALLRVKETSASPIKMQIDGERAPNPGLDALYNVAPGSHVLTFYVDLVSTMDDLARCTTPVEVSRDEVTLVVSNATGCVMNNGVARR